jgi:hypothetical protein
MTPRYAPFGISHAHNTPQSRRASASASAYTHSIQPWSVYTFLLSFRFLLLAHPVHQEPSLRLVPAKAPVKASISDTANSLGLHDTLQYGPRTLADEIKTTNPLQARLENVGHSTVYDHIAKSGPCHHSGMSRRGPSS